MTASEKIKAIGINQILGYVEKDPQKNLPILMDWADRFADGVMPGQRKVFRDIINDSDNHWNRLLMSLWTDIDDSVRVKLFENFIVNASFIGSKKQDAAREHYNCNIPWAILMDPTSACNLSCDGCWAAEYGDTLSMSYDELDSIVRQGKKLGVYMYIYSGGEPLVRKKDIIKLCEAHDDCVFLSFTNGTLIDEAFADEMLRVKNFIPAISVEGFEKETDARRGKGTYAAVMRAMEILKEKKLPFGASCCYTSQNTESIGSEAYIDHLIDCGAKFAWFFTYMPIGVGSPTELIATAEQRKYMYDQVRSFRDTRPIFTLDFWNDGEYVQGCIAGGRYYLHINANGDIEPCAFIHYSDSNIREKTLLEACQSPLFMEYKKGQPFNGNHLRPCPLLDNKGRLADMVHASGAASTDFSAQENVDSLCAKCSAASDKWAPVADDIWAQSQSKAG